MNYTKGEWEMSRDKALYTFTVSSEERYPIARIPYHEDDARLISAAPEMYEALKALENYLIDPNEAAHIKMTDNMTKALNKAEGK